MSNFSNLMNEVEAIRESWGYGILEAIIYIRNNESQYPSEIRRELKEFMFQGAKMFAPKNG
jgi:hypothetical protein